VEFVMRRHAVIVAAALAWLVSNEGAEAKLDILVDKATQRMLVIQDGYMRYMWPVSTGRDETATPNGIYTPQRLERSWFSTAYYNSPMPYSIFFHNGYAIHGSNAINQLGGPASHGCVRLHPYHASLLFDLVQQEGPARTTIEITDEAGPGGPPLPPREFAAGRGGFEPPPMPGMARGRPDGPPLLPREFAAGRGGFEPPPVPSIVRARPDGPPLPAREMAAARDVEPLMPGIVRTRPDGPPLPPREIAAERAGYPPVPGIIRYRETGDMPEPPPVQRADRPHSARSALLSRQPPPVLSPQPPVLSAPPPTRRAQTDVKPPAGAPRAACAAGEAGTSDGSSDCRPKPKLAEVSPPEQPQPVQQAQRTSTGSGLKLLPASCWSGGASRWRWWGSSQRAPCK
jgi:L,D-transpeptidase catalytic domain